MSLTKGESAGDWTSGALGKVHNTGEVLGRYWGGTGTALGRYWKDIGEALERH